MEIETNHIEDSVSENKNESSVRQQVDKQRTGRSYRNTCNLYMSSISESKRLSRAAARTGYLQN